MLEIQADILNIDQLQALLKQAPEIATVEIKRALENASMKVLETMKREEPVDSGKLMQSTHIDYTPDGSSIRTGVDYAYVVHEGTGRSGVPSVVGKVVSVEWAKLTPRGREKLMAYGILPNKKGRATFVRKRETKPNPFATRTLEKTKDTITAYFEAAAERIIASI